MQVAQQNGNREEIPDKPAGHNSLRYQFCVAMVSPAEGARSGVGREDVRQDAKYGWVVVSDSSTCWGQILLKSDAGGSTFGVD